MFKKKKSIPRIPTGTESICSGSRSRSRFPRTLQKQTIADTTINMAKLNRLTSHHSMKNMTHDASCGLQLQGQDSTKAHLSNTAAIPMGLGIGS
jgi:hypothetical protein